VAAAAAASVGCFTAVFCCSKFSAAQRQQVMWLLAAWLEVLDVFPELRCYKRSSRAAITQNNARFFLFFINAVATMEWLLNGAAV
jgi:hypothetical protein